MPSITLTRQVSSRGAEIAAMIEQGVGAELVVSGLSLKRVPIRRKHIQLVGPGIIGRGAGGAGLARPAPRLHSVVTDSDPRPPMRGEDVIPVGPRVEVVPGAVGVSGRPGTWSWTRSCRLLPAVKLACSAQQQFALRSRDRRHHRQADFALEEIGPPGRMALRG